MTQTLASPSPLLSLRRWWARSWNDPEQRSVLIGLLGVLLVHLLLLLLAPYAFRTEHVASVLRPHSSSRQFNIEIAPDAFVAPPQQKAPPPFRFVEANPNAPDNVPDKTNNFAAQNQQAAQEKPTPDGKSERPAMEGRTDVQSTQIVTGQLTKMPESVPVSPAAEQQPVTATQAAPRQEQNPLPGFEKTEGDNANAYGSNIAKFAEGAKAVPEKIEGVKNAPLVQGATSVQPQIDPRHPRPRPQVVKQQQVRPAIFQENKVGTSNIGVAAWDAKWSNYGQYLQKLIEAVQIQWERILIESRVYPTSGTMVTVKFKLNKEGQISEIVSVEGTAGTQAERACASAITDRAPYGPWTDDMIAVLGESQELTFAFFYQ
jgi:hypothetical protein